MYWKGWSFGTPLIPSPSTVSPVAEYVHARVVNGQLIPAIHVMVDLTLGEVAVCCDYFAHDLVVSPPKRL